MENIMFKLSDIPALKDPWKSYSNIELERIRREIEVELLDREYALMEECEYAAHSYGDR